MSDEEIITALVEKLRREEQIARRAMDAETQAMRTVERAEEAEKKANAESIEAQRIAGATRRALKELGWEDEKHG